ncbi:26S proteasome non-ATPase regulatory subunit 5 [Hippoglossus hippoglossus]|uniref:26S proteasome non-ATPase regulatory subunit 5 n=1 Tax=Hippoglossus hippoglossus TaxID=8267 RepID=UPI00148B60D5|nr:26S proteasome non-ATPase regulatory subunit 5 [Hippoglossus hippoglossus]XP_034997226.1 26S proteasome non-ATPase regulatory subunit 5 [Hippoglossus stenolepis]
MAASIDSLLEEISAVEDPIEELQGLRTALLSLPVSALRDAVSGTRLDVIFSLLNSNHREQVELCVDILERILLALSPEHLAQNFRVELQAGLNHPNDKVKILALTQIGRMMENSDAVTKILNNHDILQALIHCIRDEKMAVAKQAIQSLTKLSHSKSGLDKLFHSELLNVMKEVMATSDIVRYRLYELVVEIASVSPISLGYCASSSLVSQLLSELTGDDVLIRATAIEMVTTLAHSQHGRRYLAQQGIMDKISNMIRGADTDPLSSLYLPGLVKFFGNLAIADSPQQVCETYPAFQNKVFEMALDPDAAMIGVALDTLGLLGATVEGKQVLQKTGETFKAVLLRMSKLAGSGATELRVRSLEAISELLTLEPEQQTEDLLALTESWFHLLSKQPIDMIRTISTQPFPELHCGAMGIFTAIAIQPWGQKLMVSTPGFMEFILDRSMGQTKEAKDAKFELVGSLLSSSTAAEILGSQHYIRLRTYLREGAYYVTAVATVSTERAE